VLVLCGSTMLGGHILDFSAAAPLGRAGTNRVGVSASNFNTCSGVRFESSIESLSCCDDGLWGCGQRVCVVHISIALTSPDTHIDVLFTVIEIAGSRAMGAHQSAGGADSATVAKAASAAGDLCEEGPHLSRPYEPQQVVEWIKRLRSSKPL
jgi:hypothetical protein